MARRPTRPRRDPDRDALIERTRRLLGVLEDAHAVHARRRGPEDDPWGHYGREYLLRDMATALDGYADGLPDTRKVWVIDDVDGLDTAALDAVDSLLGKLGSAEEDGGRDATDAVLADTPKPWPTRPAELTDVLAWLEAVVEPRSGQADTALVSLDYIVYGPPATFRVPPEPDFARLATGGVAVAVDLEASDVATPPAVSPGALALARMGPDTVALEQTLARAPLFAPSTMRHGLQLELGLWRETGSLYGRPFRVLEPRGPLTPRDALGLAHIIRRWADDGYPEDRRVRASENEAVGWFGYSATGGRQRGLLRDAMARLRATTFESASRVEAGRSDTLIWGLLDYARMPRTGPEGRVSVTLSEPLSYLVRTGKVAYLSAPTFAALVADDELAARLWVFLEAEDVPWRWSLYSAPEGQPDVMRDTPAIADLLRISGWEQRRAVANRVREAVRVIGRHDPRYRLTLSKSPKGRGMWTLEAGSRVGTPGNARVGTPGNAGVLRATERGTAGNAGGVLRVTRSRSKQGVTVGSLPSAITVGIANPSRKREDRERTRPSWDTDGAVMDAWHARYPHPPTTAQLRFLLDLVAEYDAAGIARALREAPAGDALEHVRERRVVDRARARADRQASKRPRREDPEDVPAALGSILAARVPPSPAPTPTLEDEDPAEVAARRRRNAVLMLRSGLSGDIAARLMADYGISEDELRG